MNTLKHQEHVRAGMRAGWEVKTLGEVCEIIGGGTPSKDKPEFYNGEILWATVRDMKHDFISETEFRITKDAVNNSATNIIPAGNVVIATRVGLGKVCIVEQDTAINQDLRGVIPIDPNKLFIRYLFWWFKITADVIVAEGTGATVQGVKLPFIKSLPVPLPPLAEQQRIVAILDEAFEGIATARKHAEQNLLNAKALFESHLEAVFSQKGDGWVEKKLGDVYDVWSSKRIMETDWTESGVPFYGGRELVQLAKYGTTVSNAFISEEKYQDYASKFDMPQKDDVLITARGTIGVGYVVNHGDKFYYKDGNIISMRAKVASNPYFLLYQFRSAMLQIQFDNLNGTTVRHLSIEKAKELVLNLPDKSIQDFTMNYILNIENETNRLCDIYTQKIAALDALKKSLLHQAFSGEL